MKTPPSDPILSSWQDNSQSWINTIDNQEIASRNLATNAAIVEAINAYDPKRILDVGCGEGWLSRAIYQSGREIVGIDGVQTLIENATAKEGGPKYYCYSYDNIQSERLPKWPAFDLIVFNFALFEEAQTFRLLEQLKKYLQADGHLLIQTIGLLETEPSGWHTEDWRSMQQSYPAPFPWYYRSRQDWVNALANNKWKIVRFQDVIHPENGKLLSWIIDLNKTGE